MNKNTLSRRDFIKLSAEALLASLVMTGSTPLARIARGISSLPESNWPTGEEEIITRIEGNESLKGKEMWTTLCLRKLAWEGGIKDSDWFSHQDLIKSRVKTLAKAGIKGGRLVIFPFEVTEDDEKYNWEKMDTAVGIMRDNLLKVDICAGPLDFPYGPEGVRLPKKYREMLQHELVDKGIEEITIKSSDDVDATPTSRAIAKYALGYLSQVIKRYDKDPDVYKLYLNNEPSDDHLVEGVKVIMTISPEFLLETVKLAKSLTKKKIAINTNIHPSNIEQLKLIIGPAYNELKSQLVIGIDAYPSREWADPNLQKQIPNYGELMDKVRETFPEATIVFTELEAQPWPPDGVAGDSWEQIYREHPNDVVKDYYQKVFPPTLDDYVAASKIQEVGLYGAEAWFTYDFPLKMLEAVSKTMGKKK